MVLVHGTAGSGEENAWSFARARFDAETFWYRGNGSLEVVSDREFLAAPPWERSVVLYGNETTNAAFAALLPDSPVRLASGLVEVGGRTLRRDDVGCLLVRPRPGSGRALVAVVGGTGLAGMRTTALLPYFTSGTAYPDLLLLDAAALEGGAEAALAAGWFGGDWSLEQGELAWRE